MRLERAHAATSRTRVARPDRSRLETPRARTTPGTSRVRSGRDARLDREDLLVGNGFSTVFFFQKAHLGIGRDGESVRVFPKSATFCATLATLEPATVRALSRDPPTPHIRIPCHAQTRATARQTRRSRSFPVAASRGFANLAGDGREDGKTRQFGDESRPGASRLFDEALAKGTSQNPSQNHAKMKTTHAVATHARVALASPNVVPAAAAAAAAAAAGAFLLRRKKGWANADARDPSSSPLVPAATASGEAAWTDPRASPAPRLDIAGDAFSSFAAGEDVKANAARAARLERNASLEAELADLELDLAAFEAALKSGGKALRRATSATSATKTNTETIGIDRDPGRIKKASRPNATTKTTDARRDPVQITPPLFATKKDPSLSLALEDRLFSEKVASSSPSSPFDLPPSASTAWWDVDIDERAYRPAPTRKMKDAELRDAERRREARKKRRVAYFRTNVSVRAASVLVARRAEQDLLTRLAPSSPLDARVFDSRVIGPAAYGVALAALCKEQNLGDVRGEGTFSDVYATEPVDAAGSSGGLENKKKLGDWSFAGDAAPGFDAEPPRFCALLEETNGSRGDVGEEKTYRTARAVIKCSVPFPGAVNGRGVGDGLRVGETEARVLASLPPHENVVRLLAAFLSQERNESYLLLKDAGTNLHAMRERGEVSPKDVRRHARVVLNALAHCHAHGVVHRDVKGGNVLVADESGYPFPRATLIDFGVARHVSVPDTEPASRYGTPGYQAPELLMTDMRRAEKNHELYAKVDVFALGCTLFFLCVGKELFGATPGDDGADEFGARTKTKARAQLAQEMMDETMEKSGAGGTDETVAFESVEEGMVVRRRKSVKNKARDSAAEPDADTNFAAAALARALGRAAERAELESRETEQELDVLMLKSMAEFPGYEPRTPEEVAFVERTYGGGGAPPHRESLAAFVNRKVTPRQPPGFASLIGACLARDPEDRPSAAEALNWPGAWVELDDDAS